jgi:hypothetical protein
MLQITRMKTTNSKLIPATLLVVACLSLAGVNAAFADHGADDHVNGNESFEFEVMLTPTAAAPAGSSIKIELEAEDEHGSAQAKLELEAHHLVADTYSIRATQKSDGSIVALGSFTTNGEGEAEVKFGAEGVPFPANFSPFDIATVSVLNSKGVVVFQLDLTQAGTVPGMIRTATVQATAGPRVPNASATVILNAFMAGSKPKGSLQLIGTGLPPKLQVAVTVNGVRANVKKATSSNAGGISVKIKPKGKNNTIAPGVNLFQAASLRLTDKTGNIIFSADF